MNVRLLLLPALVVALLSGCRKDPYLQVYIDNMNAEKRMLEDTLYELQHDYDYKVSELDKLRQELKNLKSGGVDPRRQPGPSTPRSDGTSPRTLFPNIPDLKPPTIDEGDLSNHDELPPANRNAPKRSDPRAEDQDELPGDEGPDDLEPPKLDLGGAGDSLSAVPLPDVVLPSDQQITQLHLDPARTGGWQRDDQPGDDGIVVVLQPRNVQNDFVPLPGRVSVALLDEETRSRVARWEFAPEDIQLALQRARAGGGIELTMPWQESPPEKSRFHLFVRYWLPDGGTVQQDRSITITPHGQLASRWTPRSPSRPGAVAESVKAEGNTGRLTGNASDGSGGAPPQDTWEASRESAASEIPVKQARRPQWRPYR